MSLGPDWMRERAFWRRNVDRDVDDELAFHLEMRARLYESAGMESQRARDSALHRFGDVADVRARCLTITHERERRMRRLEAWATARQHARYAVRRLRHAPGFAGAVLLMFALGIGATTAAFSLVDGVLLRPLPFPDPERLVHLSHTIVVSGVSKVEQSDASFLLYERHNTVFAGIGAYRDADVNLGATSGGATSGGATSGTTPGSATTVSERVTATGVSVGLFPTLGVAPLLGRGFRPGEDRPGAPNVVVLSAGLWRRRFGGDRSVLGQHVTIDGTPREVIGVMPDRFRYPGAATGLWYPLRLDPAHANPGNFNFTAVARLRPGVSADGARAQLAAVLPRLMDEYPSDIPRAMFDQVQMKPVVAPLRDMVVGDVARMLWILLGAVALVLLVACANVASLFLVRAEGAQRELAVRGALGAGRGAVLSQYLSEGLLLAAAGGTLGIGLAALALRALGALPGGVNLPRLAEVSVNGPVLAFACAATAFCALAVSLLPVLRARRLPISAVLRESGRSATAGPERQRARSVLVVAQVALALVLVAGSGLMARSFARLRGVQPGFDASGVLTVRVALPHTGYADARAEVAFYDALLAAVRALPGVRTVGLTDLLPMGGDHNDGVVAVEDHPLPPNAVPAVHYQANVSEDYFAALGIPLLAGHTFAPHDVTRPSHEVIASHAFAERYWKGGSAIGKRVRPGIDGPWLTIVGVVGDVHFDALEQPAEQAIYFPLVTPDQNGLHSDSVASAPRVATVVVRANGDPTALTASVRRIVRGLDPVLPTYDERPMAAVLDGASARTAFTVLLLGAASAIALVLGAVGMYGVMAYGVTLRRREIGVRIAIGAQPADVSRMISRHGVALAATGVAVGLVAAIGLTRYLRTLLYDVSPTDPLTLGGTCLVLLGVALVATWLPARRAGGVDPMEALRRD